MADLDPIFVFRDKLLPRSETFVLRHYDHMERFRPIFIGGRRVSPAKALDMTPFPAHTLRQEGGRNAEMRFRLTGRSDLLEQWFRDYRPSLVHAHFGKGGARILPFALQHRLPLVVSFHGGDATKEKHFNSFWSSLSVFAARLPTLRARTDLFLTDSGYLRQKLIERGFPGERIETYHIGIDTSRYQPFPAEARRQDILFVGRFVEKKGISYLLQAMAHLHARCPGLTLRLVGDGPLRPGLEQEVQGLGLGEQVQFLGWQPPEQVRDLVGKAAMVAVPSVVAANGDCEGLPSVIYEAAAMATPIVATTHSGIPEAVTHGETALLCPERDPEALAQEIERLHQDSALRLRLGQAARQHAETALDTRVRGRALEDLFARVLAQRA